MKKIVMLMLAMFFVLSACGNSEQEGSNGNEENMLVTVTSLPPIVADYSLDWQRPALSENSAARKIENSFYCYDPNAYKLLTENFKEWLDDNCTNLEYATISEDEKFEFSKKWEQPINYANVTITKTGEAEVTETYYYVSLSSVFENVPKILKH